MQHKIIPLWNSVNDIPYYNDAVSDFIPSITDYKLCNTSSKSSTILVIPGGGYSGRADDHEGKQIAELLNVNGISAFVLNYRVFPYHRPAMDEDVKRAIRLIRYNADKWNLDKEKIGVVGFSAGGHLTCMSALDFDYGKDDLDEIDKISCRPHTAAPCYAVSSLDKSITHIGTRETYLGENNTDEVAFNYSAENLVRSDAPPFFLWHTEQDDVVPVQNSLRLATALCKEKIPVELHIYPYGGHGMGLAESNELAKSWSKLYIDWLKFYKY